MSTDLTIVAWLDAECQTFRTTDPRHYDKALVLESDALRRIIYLRTEYEAMRRDRDLEKRWRKESDDLATDLAERVKVLEANDRRYRWLRIYYTPVDSIDGVPDEMDRAMMEGGVVLDAAIDAAIDSVSMEVK